MGNWKDEYLNVTDIQFFVSYSNTVGYRARDERWSSSINYEGKSFEDLLGKKLLSSLTAIYLRAAKYLYALPHVLTTTHL